MYCTICRQSEGACEWFLLLLSEALFHVLVGLLARPHHGHCPATNTLFKLCIWVEGGRGKGRKEGWGREGEKTRIYEFVCKHLIYHFSISFRRLRKTDPWHSLHRAAWPSPSSSLEWEHPSPHASARCHLPHSTLTLLGENSGRVTAESHRYVTRDDFWSICTYPFSTNMVKFGWFSSCMYQLYQKWFK